MGFIRIHERSKPAKKKPGWKAAAAEYDAWLKGVQSMSSGIRKPSKIQPVRVPVVFPTEPLKAKFVQETGTKPVPRPERQYSHDAELLQRELIARERKFNSAPAFNKGGPQFVSEDELVNVLSTNRRRP